MTGHVPQLHEYPHSNYKGTWAFCKFTANLPKSGKLYLNTSPSNFTFTYTNFCYTFFGYCLGTEEQKNLNNCLARIFRKESS